MEEVLLMFYYTLFAVHDVHGVHANIDEVLVNKIINKLLT